MSENDVPIVLVDGTSYIYRAFHALPALTNSQGRNTGAVKGVVNMLRRLQKDYPESPVAAVVRRQGQDLPKRHVRQVQGQPATHARRVAGADRAHLRNRPGHGPALPLRGWRGGGRCDRHPGPGGRRGGPPGDHVHRRQGHGPAGGRPGDDGQHHDRHRHGLGGRGGKARRPAAAGHRPAGPDGRQGGQHSRRSRRGREDRPGPVAKPGRAGGHLRPAGKGGRPGGARRQDPGHEAGGGTGQRLAVLQAGHHQDRCGARCPRRGACQRRAGQGEAAQVVQGIWNSRVGRRNC